MKGEYRIRRFTKACRVNHTNWDKPYGKCKYVISYVRKGGETVGDPLAIFPKYMIRHYVKVCERLNKSY